MEMIAITKLITIKTHSKHPIGVYNSRFFTNIVYITFGYNYFVKSPQNHYVALYSVLQQ